MWNEKEGKGNGGYYRAQPQAQASTVFLEKVIQFMSVLLGEQYLVAETET